MKLEAPDLLAPRSATVEDHLEGTAFDPYCRVEKRDTKCSLKVRASGKCKCLLRCHFISLRLNSLHSTVEEKVVKASFEASVLALSRPTVKEKFAEARYGPIVGVARGT